MRADGRDGQSDGRPALDHFHFFDHGSLEMSSCLFLWPITSRGGCGDGGGPTAEDVITHSMAE